MASLTRRRKPGFIAAAVATIFLIGLFVQPTLADGSVELQKVRRLEVLGLDTTSPEGTKAALEALTLYAVDVVPDDETINVVLQLSGLPTYDSYIYAKDKRRLVVDLRNTVNLSPASVFSLSEQDPIRSVRNSQYRVTPSIISRIVLDLDESAEPQIQANGNNIVISVPLTGQTIVAEAEELADTDQSTVSVPDSSVDAQEEPDWDDAIPSEVVAVPAIEVETGSPEVEYMVAKAAVASDAAVESSSAQEEPTVESAETFVEPEPVVEASMPEIASAASANDDVEEEIVAIAEDTVEMDEVAEDVSEEIPVSLEPMEPEVEAIQLAMVEEEVVEHVEIEELQEEVSEPVPAAVTEMEAIEDIHVTDSVETAEVVETAPVETSVQDEEQETVEEVTMAMADTEDTASAVEVAETAPEVIEEKVDEAPMMLTMASEENEAEESAPADADTAEAPMEQPVEDVNKEPVAIDQAEAEEGLQEFTEMFSGMLNMMGGAMEGDMPTESETTTPVSASSSNSKVNAEIKDNGTFEETLVTLTFRDASLSSVLDILARKGKLNILAGKDVRGNVTVRLVDVPLDVALNAILNVNGYGYMKTDNIIRILPLSQLGEKVKTVTETHVLSYAQAQKAKGTLESFLTPNGNIETDERTNMLIVTDVPNNMDKIRKLIPQIDTRVQQVLIEVLILDSVLTNDSDLGIQWQIFNTDDNSLDAFGDPDSIVVPFGFPEVLALNLSFGTLLGDIKLDSLIQAVVDDTDAKVLANPKLLTLNNEKATIEIITEFPYQELTETAGGGELVSTSFKEVGTKLEVQPQITDDRHVILKIIPEQSSVVDIDEFTKVPIVATRTAETTLIVKDHQTLVLGGLRSNARVKSILKVPFLGDLPGVKYIFRSVSSDESDTELLMFLTVHIVESPQLLPDDQKKFEELAHLPRNPNTAIDLIR